MKVYFIDECLDKVGGVERVICCLANTLYNKSIPICVISESKNNEKPFFNYNSNIEINYLMNKEYYFTSKIRKKNVVYYFLRVIDKIRRKLILSIKSKKIVNEINENDVIVFGRIKVALDFLPVINKSKKNIKIICRDAINIHFFKKVEITKMKKYFPNLVNYLIVSSEESRKEYQNLFLNSNIKIEKIYNPIGIVPNVKYCYENKTIVSIGRMDDNQKGFDNLIKSFLIVHKNSPEWKLELYGDGNLKYKYSQMIKEANAQDYIKIYPSTNDVVSVFNRSSIFVLASRYEGYANILVEALACGIPSISYNWYTGVDDIINDGKNGKIVKLIDRENYFNGCVNEYDVINLANMIEYLIKNKSKCDFFSKNSPKIYDNRNIEYIINKWERMINVSKNFDCSI